jgi:hypothetical protein
MKHILTAATVFALIDTNAHAYCSYVYVNNQQPQLVCVDEQWLPQNNSTYNNPTSDQRPFGWLHELNRARARAQQCNQYQVINPMTGYYEWRTFCK